MPSQEPHPLIMLLAESSAAAINADNKQAIYPQLAVTADVAHAAPLRASGLAVVL
jgi:hypothetical protein